MPALYPIKVIALKTGLSPHVIRMWEKRYQAVKPHRTPTNRRVYSDDDLLKLALLGQLTATGHHIGAIAKLGMDDLRHMAANTGDIMPSYPTDTAPGIPPLTEPPHERFIALAWASARKLNAERLAVILRQALAGLGKEDFFVKFLTPLLIHIGRLWRETGREEKERPTADEGNQAD